MSCFCQNIGTTGHDPGCPCDIRIHPPVLEIPAGLSHLPRQIATFPEFRTAMLAMLREMPPLSNWRAREEDDLGLMLLEMWAYVCDSLSFYDEVIAQEAYLRTAERRPSLRKLVDLLGYLPRPAVAAFAKLAAFADGRQSVTLPVGTAFRSGAFDGEPPQVFELDKDTVIHPLTNKWTIQPPIPTKVGTHNPNFLYAEQRAELAPGTLVLLVDSGNQSQNQPAVISKVENVTSSDRRTIVKVSFQSALKLSGNTPTARLKIYIPNSNVGLWTISSTPASVGSNTLTLESLNRNIRIGEKIIASRSGELRWFKVSSFSEEIRAASPKNEMEFGGKTYDLTGNVSFTTLTLDASLNSSSRKKYNYSPNWSNGHRKSITVYYDMREAGIIVRPAKTELDATDPLVLTAPIETPLDGHAPEQFFFEDKNITGIEIGASINYNSASLTLDQGTTWSPSLTLPVELFGNLIEVTRGELVVGEIIGSGDASASNQVFKLKKKPLTYLNTPTAENDQGVKSTLTIHVNGVQWTEVSSFFGKKEHDQVYIVRQDDEGDSFVTFGDGIRGERLPTGQDNVVATYRYGAGTASPPAGSINQIGKPVKDLQSVKNPLPASGGADAEAAEDMRDNAPKSVLVLGRAVSIQDMEAVALSVPGVRAAQAEWRWHGGKQRPVVNIFFIGETGIETLVRQRLASVTDPSTPFQVELAEGTPSTLSIDINIDPRYIEADVLIAVREVLSNSKTGLLAPENIGIGKPLYRSQIFDAVLSVEGTVAVRGIHWNSTTWSVYAKTVGAGKYFDLETGELIINGKSS